MLQYNVTFGTTWVARPSTQSIMFSTGCHRCSRRCRCVPSVSLSVCVCLHVQDCLCWIHGSDIASVRSRLEPSYPLPICQTPCHKVSRARVLITHCCALAHSYAQFSLSLSLSFAFSQMASSFSSLFSSSQRSASSAGDLSSVLSCDAQL